MTSDESWRISLDPAYERHETNPNYRLAEPTTKYNAEKEISGWKKLDFDDSQWQHASERARNKTALVERPIPQWKNEPVQVYQKEGELHWKEEYIGHYIELLKLPEEYRVTIDFQMEYPGFFMGQAYDLPSCLELLARGKDDSICAKIRLSACREVGVGKTAPSLETEICSDKMTSIAESRSITELYPGRTLYDERHTLSLLIEKDGFTGYMDGVKLQKQFGVCLGGGTVGISNVKGGMTKVYSMRITDKAEKNVIFDADISKEEPGGELLSKKRTEDRIYISIKPCVLQEGNRIIFL